MSYLANGIGIAETRQMNKTMLIRKAAFLIILLVSICMRSASQNLVINPGAELSPAGTGWTIVSAGANLCAAGSAASTYSNWTMIPDNSANYPNAHSGTKTFFAGCNTAVPAGPFELRQVIDISADATQIDAGSITFTFTGYIQTPVSTQPDAGRFIVDYLNASDVVLGSSYTSTYQSNSLGSGTTWNLYTNVRPALSGTRKIRIRLQSTVATGPAINAYFDDISLTKSVTMPIKLISFSGQESPGNIQLKWSISDAVNFSRFEIEKSKDATSFVPAGTVDYVDGTTEYFFRDKYTPDQTRIFYRLKMIDVDARYTNSPIVAVNISSSGIFVVSPNPASTHVVVTGLHNKGSVLIRSMDGYEVIKSKINGRTVVLNVSKLPKGIYVISYSDENAVITKQLIIQ